MKIKNTMIAQIKSICLAVFSVLSIYNAVGQCPEFGQYAATNQAEVDNFMTMYPDCQQLLALSIVGDDVISISALSGLQEVHTLVIENSQLRDFSEVEGIRILDGLSLNANSQLLTIEHLSLSNTVESIWIWGSGNLRSVDFSTLDQINDLSIFHPYGYLDSIYVEPITIIHDGLTVDKIHTRGKVAFATTSGDKMRVNKSLELEGNVLYPSSGSILQELVYGDLERYGISLIDSFSFDGFRDSLFIDGLILSSITTLEDSALQALENVTVNTLILGDIESLRTMIHMGSMKTTRLVLYENRSLHNLNGFDKNLQHLRSISILDNPELDDISALDGVDSLYHPSFDVVRIEGNSKLNDCALDFICTLLAEDSQSITVSGNGGLCESKEVVADQCITSVDAYLAHKSYVYPNPAIDLVHIIPSNHQQIKRVDVFSIIGEKYDSTARRTSDSRWTIDMRDVATGTYFLRIGYDDRTHEMRTIVIVR